MNTNKSKMTETERTENERKLREKIEQMEAERRAAPQVRGVLQWIRSQGYSLSTALLELLDNSLSAKAKRVVVCMYSDGNMLARMVMMDNGNGMTRQELEDAFVVAGNPKSRAAGDIGKFRVGMKGAAWSQTRELTIASWSPDGSGLVGLRANVESMVDHDTFQPNEVGMVDETWLRNHFKPKDVEAFLEAKTGTMIQINNFWMDCVQHYNEALENVCKAVSSGYVFPSNDVEIECVENEKPAKKIESKDLFHYNDAEDTLDFPAYETVFGVYSAGVGEAHRVIEHVRMDRTFQAGRGVESVRHGEYLEYKLIQKGKKAAASWERIGADEVEKLKDKLIGMIPVRIIQTTEEVDAEERKEFPNRKGFWFFREIRCVGQGLNIGKKIHDRSTNCVERQRMLIQFPPELDEILGSKFNKQMEANNALPSQVLTDALYSLYKQVTGEWTKRTDTPPSSPTANPVATFDALSAGVPQAEAHVEVPTPEPLLQIQNGKVGDGERWIQGHGAAEGLRAWLVALKASDPEKYRQTLEFLAAQ